MLSQPRVRPATMTDFDDILKIVVDSYTGVEPLSTALDVTEEEATPFVEDFLMEYLPRGYSLVIECDGIVQGVHLINICDRTQNLYDSPPEPSLSPKILFIEMVARSLSHQFWNILPREASRVLHTLYIAVRPTFQKRGAATTLIKEGLTLASEHAADIVMMECLSGSLIKIAKKFRFDILRSFPISDWKDENEVPVVDKDITSQLIVGYVDKTISGET